MKVPSDPTKVHDHPLATLWFDQGGILHKISKRTPRTVETVSDLYTEIRRATKGHKVCAIFEVSNETASNKEVQDYLKKEIPELFKAVAFISKTPTGTMVGIITSILAPVHVPTKVFKDESSARQWLESYIHLC
jgi:hypothetical protein